MKSYETPDAEVIYFDITDIIATSDPDSGGVTITPGGDEFE